MGLLEPVLLLEKGKHATHKQKAEKRVNRP
jgi:hypothetical protein